MRWKGLIAKLSSRFRERSSISESEAPKVEDLTSNELLNTRIKGIQISFFSALEPSPSEHRIRRKILRENFVITFLKAQNNFRFNLVGGQ